MRKTLNASSGYCVFVLEDHFLEGGRKMEIISYSAERCMALVVVVMA